MHETKAGTAAALVTSAVIVNRKWFRNYFDSQLKKQYNLKIKQK